MTNNNNKLTDDIRKVAMTRFTSLLGRRPHRRRIRSTGTPYAPERNPRPISTEFNSSSRDSISCAPQLLRAIMTSSSTLLLSLIAFRVANAAIVQTSYVPDEYWQSLEVAHRIAFGYGYLTWEWVVGIRSVFYPSVFAVVFKLLEIFHLDFRLVLIKVPRIMQAILAALGDLYIYKLSYKMSSSHKIARWTIVCQLTSWFMFYAITRTLSNSTETSLTTIALYYYPWNNKASSSTWKYITLVGVCCLIRPTAAILWTPLVIWHLYRHGNRLMRTLASYVFIGTFLMCIFAWIDHAFYRNWTNVHVNFVLHNVFRGVASRYGTHPWHWYLCQGLPVIIGPQLVITVLSIRRLMCPSFIAIIAWTLAVYSCLGHKEFRFLMPILPLCMHLCGCYLGYLTSPPEDDNLENSSTESDEETDDHRPLSNADDEETPCHQRTRLLCLLLLLVNIPIAMYTCLIHQRGVVDVMSVLHRRRADHIIFLMPCHSTPYYGYMHRNVSMDFLTCDPYLGNDKSQAELYVDEADRFYEDPVKWLNAEYVATPPSPAPLPHPPSLDQSKHALPSYIVIFSSLRLKLERWLQSRRYTLSESVFHTHSPQGRVGSHVLIFTR